MKLETRNLKPPPWSWPVLVLMLAWAVIFLSIHPGRQDFPLGDDWAFARGAFWFAHGQGIHYSNWASMPQLGQWLWAWPFLKIFPWPHVALRLSVIALSCLGLVAFYDLMRLEKVPPQLAALAASVLALNPLFFVSQGTFMTDVPAMSFALLSLDFFSRAAAEKKLLWLVPAVVAAVFAITTRQTMVAVPLAAIIPILRNPEARANPLWGLSIFIPLLAFVFVSVWFSHRSDVLPMRASFGLTHLQYVPFVALHWCGLLVLPLFFVTARQTNWRFFLAGFAFMLLLAASLPAKLLPFGGMFPYCTGIFGLQGAFSDGLVVGHRDLLLITPVRVVLSILGFVGGAKIIADLCETIRLRRIPGALLVFTFLQFLVTMILPGIMDRYLETLFPGALLLIATRGYNAAFAKFARLTGLAAAAASGLLSIVLLHDWLSWNSVRWQIGRTVLAANPTLQPADIEGGFEWDGWYASADPAKLFVATLAAHPPQSGPSLSLPFSRRFFPMVNGRFALAFTQPPNSVVVASASYSRWLPPAKKEFFLVQAKPAPVPETGNQKF